MKDQIRDRIRLLHILDAIEEINSYIKNDIDLSKFHDNSMLRFACIKQLEIIGEASIHISEEIKNKYNDIEWHQLRGLRNILIHEYFGVDTSIVWEIIKMDLPLLKHKIKIVLEQLG